MKRPVRFFSICTVLCISLLNWSCESNNLPESNYNRSSARKPASGSFSKETPKTIVTKSQAEQYAYVSEHLKTISKAVAAVSGDRAIRDLIYSEVSKQFDKEYHVLIEDVLHSPLVSQSPKGSVIGRYLNSDSVAISLAAFKGIDGQNYYPQIFIPFFNKHKNTGRLGGSPIIVPWNGSEATDRYEGYVFKNNEFIKLDFLIDENFARQHEVWVFSLNE